MNDLPLPRPPGPRAEELELTLMTPTLNEGGHLARVLTEAKAAAAELTGSFEVLVIDGGSTDDTVAAARAAGARVERQNGKGFGQAIREGLAHARGKWILVIDADGSHPPRFFKDLWARRQEADLVIASRFVTGGKAEMPWHRYWLSVLLNEVTRRVLDFPVRDSSSGFKLYRAATAARLPLKSEDFSVQQETLAHILALGGRAVEIPFSYEPRLGGESKADISLLARRYLGMLARLRRLRGGWAGPGWGAAALALGMAVGLWGITWGLPGPARRLIFPESMLADPDTARKLAESWSRLYQGIERAHRAAVGEEPVTYVQGVELIAPGWTWPPDKLANSYRSLLLRSEHPDEQKSFVILGRMRPWRLEFQPLYIMYGGAFIYPLGAFLQTAAVLRLAHVVPDLRHYLLHPEDMGRLILLGRIFVLLFQVGAFWIVFDLGRRLSGPRTGFLAAALLALTPVFVANSHLVKPHAYSAFWALAALRYLFLAHGSGRWSHYALLGLCLGIAAGSSASLLCLAWLPLLALLARRLGAGAGPREPRRAAAAMALSVGLYVLTNPYAVLAARDYIFERTLFFGKASGWGTNMAALFGPWSLAGLGPALTALSAAALGAALWRREPSRRLLAVAFLAGTSILCLFLSRLGGFMEPGAMRFFYPLFGLTCVLGADLVCSSRLPAGAKALIWLVVFCDIGLRSFVYLRNFGLDAGPGSTRVQAGAWIDAALPAGTTLGLPRYPQPAHTPLFRYDRYRLVIFEDFAGLPPAQKPDYLIVDGTARDAVEASAGAEYRLERAFRPFELAWARTEASFFPNAGMFILKRQPPGAP